jgi:hypothetical protein
LGALIWRTERIRPGTGRRRVFNALFALGLHILTASCVPFNPTSLRISPVTPTLWLMPVADLGADILVESLEEAAQRLDFVDGLGGHITAIRVDDVGGSARMTAEFRIPHEHTQRVADILRSEFGEVTYLSALASDVSVRNARLRRELASLEASLGGLSGSEWAAATERIQLLRDSIAFQEVRATYLFVMVRFFESP